MNTQTKTSVVGWFNQRGLEPLDYQPMAIITTIKSDKKKVVLAAAPNSGKTTMTICIIDLLKEVNPNMKVLILTHNQIILRDNFIKNIDKLGKPFNYQVIESGCDDITEDVVISIPATMINCKNLPKFDLVIVDEAHEYYKKDMVQTIIKKVKPSREILLTGTPSPFIGDEKYDLVYVTGMDVYEAGNSADVYTEISTSTYFMDQKDYNTDGEVHKSYNFGKNETIVTLDDVMSKVYNRLVSKMRQPKNYAYSPLVDWVFLNKNMGRTMIACRNQSQAKKVGDYFTSKGIKNIVSISDSDSDNELLRAWEQKQEYRVLIVVRRGILGFSDETLVNLVDMTMSKNINRMFQLYNRVTRKFGDTKKLYIKVVPANLSDYHSVFVAGMLSMLHEEWYTKFNGKNFYEMRIPIKKNTTKRNGGTGISKSTTKVKLRIEDLGCIQPQEMFQYLNSNKSKLLNPEYWVDMRTVMIKLDEHYSNGKTTWNLSEKIVDENYSQFENKTLSELESTYQGSVARARKFGYHNELLEKYNITKDYYRRNTEDRAQIIIDFCKKNNITKRHELRNHSQEGQKHYAWVKKRSEIGDKILPPTTIKWTVESVLQTEKEAKEKKIGFKTYSASAWNAKRRFIKQGLIQ
jgi:hypothetical protein